MPWIETPGRRLLSEAGERRLEAAIRAAEGRTSGEIRVHVERRCGGDALTAARRWFVRLGMSRTAERNGVLLYVAIDDHAFAIVGDEGIHAKVGPSFWDGLRDAMHADFARGEFASGIERAVAEAGRTLAEHFPRRADDRDELSNEVSY